MHNIMKKSIFYPNFQQPKIVVFHHLITRLRDFFLSLDFVEVHTQDRLSILAACEDPQTIATFEYLGEIWPLPQTGQMWLEYELLCNPTLKGVFCLSTSYRQEPNPIPGRHETIFPMLEFEAPGTVEDLRCLEEKLCTFLGLGSQEDFVHLMYDHACYRYQTAEITEKEEHLFLQNEGFVVFLEFFPQKTMPFWNMKQEGDYAQKIDVIINGVETIGSAERSTNKEEMRHNFFTISHGEYAALLYSTFGRERVNKELEEFLQFDFFPRFGGGIGLRRLMKGIEVWQEWQEQ